MLQINLDTKTIKNGKMYLLKNGIPMNGYKINENPITFELLETLYTIYKHSVPNGIKYKKTYFKALTYDELSTEDLILGANRQTSKENLELAIISGVLNGSLIWPDETKWFWQSENDKDFILLRKWMTI